MLATANVEVVQIRVEGLAYLAGGACKVDHARIVQHATNPEAVRFEPCRKLRDVFRRCAESRPELLWRKPFVIFRRSALLLACDEIVQVGLLRGAATQQKKEM